MPYALCPMPYALCSMPYARRVPHVTEKGYSIVPKTVRSIGPEGNVIADNPQRLNLTLAFNQSVH